MRNGFRHLFVARSTRVLSSFSIPALVGLSALAAGCGGDGNTSRPPDLGGGDTFKVTDPNNFSSMSSLMIKNVPVPAGEDLKVCWKGLTKDILGHTVDPAKDINDVSFIRVVSSDPTAVEKLLNDGNLQANNIDGDWDIQFPTGKADDQCIHLSDLTTAGTGTTGTPLDPKTSFTTDSKVTYLMVIANGTAIGFGARSMVILTTDPSSTTSEVDVDNTTATLSYTATLAKDHPVEVAVGELPRVDWSGVTKGGAGQAVEKNDVSRVLVGFYQDMDSAALEKNFLNLDQKTGTYPGAPTKSWEVPVASGQSIDLAAAQGRNGEGAFTGFDSGGATGSWIMGMFCDLCQNPAPVIVTLVDPK
jgi:hypothetical protein